MRWRNTKAFAKGESEWNRRRLKRGTRRGWSPHTIKCAQIWMFFGVLCITPLSGCARPRRARLWLRTLRERWPSSIINNKRDFFKWIHSSRGEEEEEIDDLNSMQIRLIERMRDDKARKMELFQNMNDVLKKRVYNICLKKISSSKNGTNWD
jgi:hypothetical protein